MLPLILGLCVFFGVHLLPASPDLRRGLIERVGETTYKAMFSIVSLVGFVLIVVGYAKMQAYVGSKNPVLFVAPGWTRHVTFLLMVPAMILLVAAYVPSRIRSAVGHPMLAAVKIWALSHLISNGDLGSLVLFGSFLAYAIFDRVSVKRRGDSGRTLSQAGGIGGDLAAVVIGLAAYAFMLLGGHGLLIGVPLVSLSFAP